MDGTRELKNVKPRARGHTTGSRVNPSLSTQQAWAARPSWALSGKEVGRRKLRGKDGENLNASFQTSGL